MSPTFNPDLVSFKGSRPIQNMTQPRHPDMSPEFGLAFLILGGAVILVFLVCACIHFIMVYVCCILDSPLRRYNERAAR